MPNNDTSRATVKELARSRSRFIPRGYSADIWIMFLTNVVTSLGFSVSMPYLSLYLNNVLHIPMTIVGTILMTAILIGAFAGMYGGEMSDRLGRKVVMVRSLFLRSLIFILLGIVIYKRASIYVITLLLIINSSLGSFFLPASQAYVADLTTEEKRTKAYGILRIGGNLGWALGPAIGGLLAMLDYSYLFFLTAACMLVAGAILRRFGRESLKDMGVFRGRARLKEIISVTKHTKFLIFTLICLSIFVVWGQLVSPLSIYSVNRVGITKSQVGILFSINGLMVVLFQYFITQLMTEKKELTALWIGSLIYAVGYLSIGFANNFAFLIFSMVIITIAEMIITPASSSYASIIADPKHRGRYLGFFNLAHSLGWAFGPLLGGSLLDTFPGRSLSIWAIVSGLAFSSAIGFAIFKHQQKARH